MKIIIKMERKERAANKYNLIYQSYNPYITTVSHKSQVSKSA